MIDLGQVDHQSATKLAVRISEMVRQQGEVAVFVTPSRNVLVLAHTKAGYQQSLDRRARQLAGRYVADEECATTKRRAGDIREDLQERLDELRAQARAA